MKRPEAYVDLHSLAEDERIDMIGHTVTVHGKTAAVCVDDLPGKPERYIDKLTRRFPGLRIIDQCKGPTPGVITIRVGPVQS